MGETEIGCERRITVPLILNGICIFFTPHCKCKPPTAHTCHLINHLLGLQLAIVIQYIVMLLCATIFPKEKTSQFSSLQYLNCCPGKQMESLTFPDVSPEKTFPDISSLEIHTMSYQLIRLHVLLNIILECFICVVKLKCNLI